MPGYCRTEECYVPPAPIPPGKQNIYFIVFICVSVCAMSVVEMFKEIIFHYRACSSWIELDHSCDNDMCYCLFNCHSILEQKKKNRKECPRWYFRPFFEVPIMCFGAIKVFQRQPWWWGPHWNARKTPARIGRLYELSTSALLSGTLLSIIS